MEEKSDAELVHLARSGSREGFDELIRRYQRSLAALAWTVVGDRFEAEDLAQEAFLRAWLNLDLLSDPAKFGPWLRRIVFGVSIDWLRAFRPDLYRLPNVDAELELFEQPAPVEPVLAALERIELRQRIWEAIARLPSPYRLPLTMFHLDGLRHSKVAEALGIPESTVRSLVARAKKKLQPMLASHLSGILPALEDVLRERASESALLHIVDGESVAGTLKESTVPGDVMIYGDLLYEGPAPTGLSSGDLLDLRARFLARNGKTTAAEAYRYLATFEHTLAAVAKYHETILWLDYRLSDQLILVRLLDWFSRQDPGPSQLSLICVGRYPGMTHFVGLGQLNAEQLVSLADTRLQVTKEQLCLGRRAWAAFTSADPSEIESLIAVDTSALPFLASALRRHLEQFPLSKSGLSRTERQALTALREGPLTAIQLFCTVQTMEDPLFMGDWSFFGILTDLASAREPLVRTVDDSPLDLYSHPTTPVTITDAGLRIVEGRDDHIRVNGIDRWIGGVHLKGTEAAWRWNQETGFLIKPGRPFIKNP